MRSNVRLSAPLARSALKSVQRRSFSASVGRTAQYGFIGLGQMGMFGSRDSINCFNLLTERRLQYGEKPTGKPAVL